MWVSVNASPLRDEACVLHGGIAVFRDVTARREELDRTRVLSAAVEHTAGSVIVTDDNGVIEYVNPAASEISGFDRGGLIGRTPRLFRSGVHDFAFDQGLWATLRAGQVFRGTIVNQHKNGDVFYSEQSITPITKGAGTVRRYVSVGKDMTELRDAAEQTSRLVVARTVQQHLYPPVPRPTCGEYRPATLPRRSNVHGADSTNGRHHSRRLQAGGVAAAAVSRCRTALRTSGVKVLTAPHCCSVAMSATTHRAAFGSKTIRRRVRVAAAKRSNASVDGRTLPPSMRAM